jgi:hypothetical protein
MGEALTTGYINLSPHPRARTSPKFHAFGNLGEAGGGLTGELRHNLTPAERKLWAALRNDQLGVIVLKKSFFCKCHCEPFFGEAISRLTGQTELLEIASAAKNVASQ